MNRVPAVNGIDIRRFAVVGGMVFLDGEFVGYLEHLAMEFFVPPEVAEERRRRHEQTSAAVKERDHQVFKDLMGSVNLFVDEQGQVVIRRKEQDGSQGGEKGPPRVGPA